MNLFFFNFLQTNFKHVMPSNNQIILSSNNTPDKMTFIKTSLRWCPVQQALEMSANAPRIELNHCVVEATHAIYGSKNEDQCCDHKKDVAERVDPQHGRI